MLFGGCGFIRGSASAVSSFQGVEEILHDPAANWPKALFQRGLALVYFIAFLVAAHQFKPLLGAHGLLPVPLFIRRVPCANSPSLFYRAAVSLPLCHGGRAESPGCPVGAGARGAVVSGGSAGNAGISRIAEG